MRKIILYILLVVANVNGKDDFCNCSCEGTKRNQSNPICDKVTGKCECRPGFSGEKCETCIEFNPLKKSCKTCDCPNANNKCEDKTKFHSLLNKFEKIKKIDVNILNELPINTTQIEDLKSKIKALLDDIEKNENIDLKRFEKLEKETEDVVKNVQKLLKKYRKENILEKNEMKMMNGLKTSNNILDALKGIEDQNNIDELAKEADHVIQNVSNILNEHDKCLDVIDQLCSVKNSSENLRELKQAVENININSYINRTNKMIKDIEEAVRVDEINKNDLIEIKFPNISNFNETTYRENHDKLGTINHRIDQINNRTETANDLLDQVKEKKEESNLEKSRAFHTILMAPVDEIQEIIDNITRKINDSNNLFNELTANKIKLEKATHTIGSELKDIEKKLEDFEKRRKGIKDKITDTYEEITEMKENLLNLTAEYKNKSDEYQQFAKEMEEDFEKMKAVLEAEIECMEETAKQAEEKIAANGEVLDALESDIENAEKSAVLLSKVEEIKREVEKVKEISDSLNESESNKTKIICPKHSLV